MIKVTHDELTKALNLTLNSSYLEYLQIETDSRKPNPQGLFWALKGEAFDGHHFIDQAITNGACGVVVHQEIIDLPKHVSCYLVTNTLEALQTLANYRAKKFIYQGTQILGITGSSGKTTCKEFTAQLLTHAGWRVHYNKGSFNNHFGVPFNLLSAPLDSQVIICEMGMNHGGEITQLVKIAQPTMVTCTMVGSAHIEHFGSIDKIALAKQEIYAQLQSQTMIFNLSNPWTLKMFNEYWSMGKEIQQRIGTFSLLEDGSIWAQQAQVRMQAKMLPNGYMALNGLIDGVAQELELSIFGEHHVTNIMAACAQALRLGISPQIIWEGIQNLHTPWGRTQLVASSLGASILFDAYNANPESMQALLTLVTQLKAGHRKWAILGEMRELGEQAQAAHFLLGSQAAQAGLAKVFFMGPSAGAVKEGFLSAGGDQKKLIISDTYKEELALQVQAMLEPNDFVVIKGSRGMRLERFMPVLQPIKFEAKTS